jgi:hypothetical protein
MSNLSDVVGGANLYGGSSYSFTHDRFCSPNSAIYFNKGYLQVPTGVYFSGDFTVTAWFYFKSYQINSRIFDFGNGESSNNVFLAINLFGAVNNYRIRGASYIGSSNSIISTSPFIKLNQWYFISFVLSGKTGFIYINGSQMATGTMVVPKNIIRATNYIGKSNWASHSNADAIYDELKIYQEALSSIDILNEYQISYNNGK